MTVKDADVGSIERISRQVQGRPRLEPIQERVIPIQRLHQQQQQQQQPDTTTTSDISRHYALYRRRASNVEPTLSTSSSSSPTSSHSLIVGADDLSGGFSLSVGRHARGFSLSLRPQQQQQQQQQQPRSSPIREQQRPLVSVVIPTPDASLRQPSPSNSASNIHDNIQPTPGDYRSPINVGLSDEQPSPSRFTIYQPLLATGRTSSQQFYDLPRRHLLLSPAASPSGLCLSVCMSVCLSNVTSIMTLILQAMCMMLSS